MLLDLSDILQVSPTFTPTLLKMPKKLFERLKCSPERPIVVIETQNLTTALETSTLLFCMNKNPDGLQLLTVAS